MIDTVHEQRKKMLLPENRVILPKYYLCFCPNIENEGEFRIETARDGRESKRALLWASPHVTHKSKL